MFGSEFLFVWLDLLSEIAGVRFGRLEVSFSEIRSLLCQTYSVCARKIAYEHRAATVDSDLQNLRVSLDESPSVLKVRKAREETRPRAPISSVSNHGRQLCSH